MSRPLHLRGLTTHARRGALKHAFSYGVDFVLVDPDETAGPLLFSRKGFNLATLRDRDHGGRRGAGRGAAWAREMLAAAGLPEGPNSRLRLLAQPRILGAGFNPVSFWLRFEGAGLVAVIAEVNNTYGDRHSYLCARPGLAAIAPGDVLTARKVFHVSPFRDIAGAYAFSFALTDTDIAIRIAHRDGSEGLVATLEGRRLPMTPPRLLGAALRFPLASFRAIMLIYWQALRLWRKGAAFRPRPLPPAEDLSR